MSERQGQERTDAGEEAHPLRSSAGLEAARILGRYRRLILLGRLRPPLEAARRLVGPDCAYRLYGQLSAPSHPPARVKARAGRSAPRPGRRGPRASPP